MKKVGIIIPCYNESKDIKVKAEIVKEIVLLIKEYHFDIIVVNDGSKDDTEEVIKTIKDINVVSYTPNAGKGHAIKEGLKEAMDKFNDDYYIFMDADLSTDLSAIKPCLEIFEEGYDFALGSRYDKDSNIAIKQPLKRRFISKCSRIIISMMFHFKLKDTQCGFKGMNKKLAEVLVNKSLMDRFSFDVEYIYIAKLNGFTYKSFGVLWRDDRGSTVSPIKSSVRFFKDLFKIKKNKKKYLIEEKEGK